MEGGAGAGEPAAQDESIYRICRSAAPLASSTGAGRIAGRKEWVPARRGRSVSIVARHVKSSPRQAGERHENGGKNQQGARRGDGGRHVQYCPGRERGRPRARAQGFAAATRKARRREDPWHWSSCGRDARAWYGCRTASAGPCRARWGGCSRSCRGQETPHRKSPGVCGSRHG